MNSYRRTKRVDTIIAVVQYGRANKLSMPEAVEAYRAELRESMRRRRTKARQSPLGSVQRKIAAYILPRLRRESARVRRLQREFQSWQVQS